MPMRMALLFPGKAPTINDDFTKRNEVYKNLRTSLLSSFSFCTVIIIVYKSIDITNPIAQKLHRDFQELL